MINGNTLWRLNIDAVHSNRCGTTISMDDFLTANDLQFSGLGARFIATWDQSMVKLMVNIQWPKLDDFGHEGQQHGSPRRTVGLGLMGLSTSAVAPNFVIVMGQNSKPYIVKTKLFCSFVGSSLGYGVQPCLLEWIVLGVSGVPHSETAPRVFSYGWPHNCSCPLIHDWFTIDLPVIDHSLTTN